MGQISKYAPGHFNWTDLGTHHLATMKSFYERLFGWSFTDTQGTQGVYSIAQLEGKDVCGLHESTDHEWIVYLASEDVEKTIQEAEAAGATVLRAPVNVRDKGRVSLVQDPAGAKFGVWESKKHKGAQITGVPGTVVWRELVASNVDFEGKFYSSVFGWNPGIQNFGEMTYYLFSSGGEDLAGMMPAPKREFSSQWLNYWQVLDCEKSVELAIRLGGKIITAPMSIPGVGKFAILADCQESVFGLQSK